MDVEDILNDALSYVFDDHVRADPAEEGVVRYGPLVLRVAPKEGKATTLLADHLFSPALIIAERIECGLIPLSGKTVLELGAGAALPSLLASTLDVDVAPSMVVVTDYPDASIMGNVERNVSQNSMLVTPKVKVLSIGHEWGTHPTPLLSPLPDGSSRYDVLVLSDLLHFDTSHPALLASLSSLLAKSSTSRAYVGAGKYTSAAVCAQWVRLAGEKGLEMEEVIDEDEWKGTMGVIWSGKAMDRQELTERKRNCRLWVGRWVTNT